MAHQLQLDIQIKSVYLWHTVPQTWCLLAIAVHGWAAHGIHSLESQLGILARVVAKRRHKRSLLVRPVDRGLSLTLVEAGRFRIK